MRIFKIFLSLTLFLLFLVINPIGLAATETAKPKVASSFFGATSDVCAFWKAIFDFAIQIAGGIALIVVAIGGLLYLVSMGNTDKQKTAKDLMFGAGLGMTLALLSWTLFTVLNPYLLQCKIEVPQLDIDISEPVGDVCAGLRKYESQEECEAAQNACNSEKPCSERKIKGVGSSGDTKEWCCYDVKPGCPINSSWVGYCYGWRKISKGDDFHNAIDILAPQNTPVVAIEDGTVTCNNSVSCNTKFAVLQTKTRRVQYFHLGDCIQGEVKKGDPIGYLGDYKTDRCSAGYHVHFGTLGKNENPMEYLPPECFYSITGSNCCSGVNCPHPRCPSNCEMFQGQYSSNLPK